MFRNKKRLKRESKEFEVDITSLLDILVILLVFLLKSYNASDLKLEVVKNLNLPQSKSQDLGHMAVIIQVDSERAVWINDKKIGSFRDTPGDKIDLLYSALEEEGKKQDKEIEDLKGRALAQIDESALKKRQANRKKVNIVLDQSLPYTVLRKVMHTAAMAGFPEFKFIVQGNF
jgi:biopolymer transport protein ExbD